MHALEFLDADANQAIDETGLTAFQKILRTPKSAEFIKLCIENGADCYAVSKAHRNYALLTHTN